MNRNTKRGKERGENRNTVATKEESGKDQRHTKSDDRREEAIFSILLPYLQFLTPQLL